ncbi:MAG: DUF3332 family protein [Leptospiraceae bacterium]|nr:DUF3332 family protein [Leptospiraceae bacterium]MCP5495027.1 DUF3332 family protein [Leptospiraceae bacterium]
MKQSIKKIVILVFVLSLSANCFGKFALAKKGHEILSGINVGGPWVSKVIRTILMYPLDGIALWVDMVILNLIEFWTDSNPLGYNEYNKNGIYVKSFQKGNENIQITYSDFGNRMDVLVTDGNKSEKFVFLREEKGKIFKEEKGNLKQISINSIVIGDRVVLKMVKDGKLESSKIVDIKNYQELENRIANKTL